MRLVTMTVTDSTGKPRSNVRVSIYVYQFAASGMKAPEYTNSEGKVRFQLNVDIHAEIEIYVDGHIKVSKGPIHGEYIVRV